MRARKAQSHIEFILAAFLFLTLIIFLFTALFVRTQPEAQKVGEQTSCQKAKAILELLTNEAGTPNNWNKTNLHLLGLTNGTQGILNYSKWEIMQSMSYSDLRNAVPINASWVASYEGFAFPNKEDSGSCPQSSNTADICRQYGGPQYIWFSVSSTTTATFDMILFFPEKQAVTVHPGAFPPPPLQPVYEADDTVSITNGDNGTTVEIHFHLDATDTLDAFSLTFNGQSIPDISYIEYAKYEALGGERPILIGNTTIKDNYGAGIPSTGVSGPSGVIPAKSYCTAQKRAQMLSSQNPYGLELHPVTVKVIAWQ